MIRSLQACTALRGWWRGPALLLLGLAAASAARAQEETTALENLTPGEIDSEHLFGFAEGSDLGVPGELELESETNGRIGRRGLRFRAFDGGVTVKVPLNERFRIAPGVSYYGYDVGGAPGLPGRTGGIGGAFLEMRLRLLDHRIAPFGLTLNAVPSFSRIEGGLGFNARSYGTEFGLLADRELIPGQLVAALNVSYALAGGRLTGTGGQLSGSGVEVAGALAYRARPGVFLGGEARYARAYAGLSLDRLAGRAFYLGPTAYVTLSDRAWMSFTWSFQVAGRAAQERRSLDLTSFDRHQMRLRVGYAF